ncbi:hypothetical protein [Paraburkholderia sp. CNPSo 3281]|uniref:hypothetical protein n=1 Tax=Paraburkholderia sp. CNPSo 3281 TaxID=2940933 RepID=UPI0020B7AD6F|nr:hypothetical protein [Paraburkholderia sp. CNPSo 3281]MCP3718939.1 hypothetical protein [Paraburkholderia sp. CNPSo 3281]
MIKRDGKAQTLAVQQSAPLALRTRIPLLLDLSLLFGGRADRRIGRSLRVGRERNENSKRY